LRYIRHTGKIGAPEKGTVHELFCLFACSPSYKETFFLSYLLCAWKESQRIGKIAAIARYCDSVYGAERSAFCFIAGYEASRSGYDCLTQCLRWLLQHRILRPFLPIGSGPQYHRKNKAYNSHGSVFHKPSSQSNPSQHRIDHRAISVDMFLHSVDPPPAMPAGALFSDAPGHCRRRPFAAQIKKTGAIIPRDGGGSCRSLAVPPSLLPAGPGE